LVPSFARTLELVIRWASSVVAFALTCWILGPRMFGAYGVYLLVPLAACSVALVLAPIRRSRLRSARSTLGLLTLAAVAVGLPVVSFVLPYVIHHHMRELVYGAVI